MTGKKASVKDRVALILASKEEGRTVDFEHVFEKTRRDVSYAEGRELERREVDEAIRSLQSDGLIDVGDRGLEAKPSLDEYVGNIIRLKKSGLNRSYALVWTAKKYYPIAGEAMLPFLRGRAVSVVKVFSGKKDPIGALETIFVRYARYKPKPVFLTIDSKEKLMSLVYDHCVDFIPYIHRLESSEPDVFVVDLDAGSELLKHTLAFEFVRYVAVQLARLMRESDVDCLLKFSGSRGFQIWSSFDNSSLRSRGDVFKVYREIAVTLQKRLEERLQKRAGEMSAQFQGLVKIGEAITTSTVAHKEQRSRQILVDWSVLKPMGDVRAPFSIHHKTGLVSVPISIVHAETFSPDEAEPLRVIEAFEKYAATKEFETTDPAKLLS